MIELENVSKRFKSKEKKYIGKYMLRSLMQKLVSMLVKSQDERGYDTVLKNISFTIEEGEHLGFVGRNKAGKTTLLQVICGITEPSSGRLQISGDIIPVFAQGNILGPDLTGREYIYLHGTALGKSKKLIAQHIERIIAFSEIDIIDTPVKFYSTGMRTRLALSVALHLPADIYVLDEVFSGSDIFFKEKVIIYLKEILKDKTLILVSHHEDIIRTFCKRLILIENGRVKMDDVLEKVLSVYNEG